MQVVVASSVPTSANTGASKSWALTRPLASGSSVASAALRDQLSQIRATQNAKHVEIAKVISSKEYKDAVNKKDKIRPIKMRFELTKLGKGVKTEMNQDKRLLVSPLWPEVPGWKMGQSLPVPVNIVYGYMSKETKEAMSASSLRPEVISSHSMKRDQLIYALVNEYNAAVENKAAVTQMKAHPKRLTQSPHWQSIPPQWKRFLTLGNVSMFDKLFPPPVVNPALSPCTSRAKQLDGAKYDETVKAAQEDIHVMLELCKHFYFLSVLKKLKIYRIPIASTYQEIADQDTQDFQKWVDEATGETNYHPRTDIGGNGNAMKPLIEQLLEARRITPKYPKGRPDDPVPLGVATGTFSLTVHIVPSGLFETVDFRTNTTKFNGKYLPSDDKIYAYWMCDEYSLLQPQDPMLKYHQIENDPIGMLTPQLDAVQYGASLLAAHVPSRHEAILQYSEFANRLMDEYYLSDKPTDPSQAMDVVTTATKDVTAVAQLEDQAEDTADGSAVASAAGADNDTNPAYSMSFTTLEYIPFYREESILRSRAPGSAVPDTVQRASARRAYRMANYDLDETYVEKQAADSQSQAAQLDNGNPTADAGTTAAAAAATTGATAVASGALDNAQSSTAGSGGVATGAGAAAGGLATNSAAAGAAAATATHESVLSLRYFSVATELSMGPLLRIWQSAKTGRTYLDLNLNIRQMFVQSAIKSDTIARFGVPPSDLKWDEFVFPLMKNSLMYLDGKRGNEERSSKLVKQLAAIVPYSKRKEALAHKKHCIMELVMYHVPAEVSGRGVADLPFVVTVELPASLESIAETRAALDGMTSDETVAHFAQMPAEQSAALQQGMKIMDLVNNCIAACTDVTCIGSDENLDAVVDISRQETLLDPLLTIARAGYELSYDAARFVETQMNAATHMCKPEATSTVPKGVVLVNASVPASGGAPSVVATIDPTAVAANKYKFYLVIVNDFIDLASGEKLFPDMDVAQTSAVFNKDFVAACGSTKFVCTDYFAKNKLPRTASFAQRFVNLNRLPLSGRRFLLYVVQSADAAKSRAALAKEAFRTDCSLWTGERVILKKKAAGAATAFGKGANVEQQSDRSGQEAASSLNASVSILSEQPHTSAGPLITDIDTTKAATAATSAVSSSSAAAAAFSPETPVTEQTVGVEADSEADDAMRVHVVKRKDRFGHGDGVGELPAADEQIMGPPTPKKRKTAGKVRKNTAADLANMNHEDGDAMQE